MSEITRGHWNAELRRLRDAGVEPTVDGEGMRRLEAERRLRAAEASRDAAALSEARVREALLKSLRPMWAEAVRRKEVDNKMSANNVELVGRYLIAILEGEPEALEIAKLSPPSSPVQVAQAMREVCEAANRYQDYVCAAAQHGKGDESERPAETPTAPKLFKELQAALSRLEALEGKS